MGRDGYIVPVDPQVGPKKKTASSRSWILMDATGEGTVLDVDKYAIMHRVQIHARDLRILDPLLSYPSTILGREKAIVLNLEHIKAIITAEEVLLRDPLDDNVIPVVEELRRRLPPINAIREVQSDGKELGGQNEVDTGEEDESPFEFRALEVALEAICSFLAARTTELETAAYPALDELTSKISSRNLDRVRKLKSAMTRLTARVQKGIKDGPVTQICGVSSIRNSSLKGTELSQPVLTQVNFDPTYVGWVETSTGSYELDDVNPSDIGRAESADVDNQHQRLEMKLGWELVAHRAFGGDDLRSQLVMDTGGNSSRSGSSKAEDGEGYLDEEAHEGVSLANRDRFQTSGGLDGAEVPLSEVVSEWVLERIREVRDELEQLLDDDDDMADLYLSRKLAGASSPVSGSGAANWFPMSPTIGSKISRASRASLATVRGDEDDVEELEMLLEAYFMQIDGTLNKLTTLREYIDDTEDYINIQLDNHRNQLIQLELFLSSGTVSLSIYSLVAGIFGMNIPYTWNDHYGYMFKWVVVCAGAFCAIVFVFIISYARYKGLVGS
ncbi:hypothetical protein TEA_008052 [Camellia sinensis var. sinensis]|uniref:Magnesium transporter n=1 Tax=Camellia sinensis var. sinensis TaxID=542762 RepID=A0A4S4DHB6_CAMSN|nr:hypothetical protein TEA_008052 [Camellia sinensis var. sinensis]